MNDLETNDADREQQLDRIIAEYACRIDAGEQVDRAALLEQHPDLADLLAEHFEDLETAEAWRQHVQPESSQIETEAYRTIKTTSPSPASSPNLPSTLTPEQRSGQELFGRYRIEGVLGEGAMVAVYLASDTKLNRRVALKIPKCNQDDPDLMQRFLREARAAATLNHRNICQVYDIDHVGDCHYISMAYIEGSPLSSFARETKMQQPRAVAQLVYKLAIAMAAAHDNGIVHRDLKPGNITVDGEQEPVIMDFGLAAMAVSDENTRLTQFGMTLGTPAYMSPEQIDGDLDRIDGRSDVFSLGVIFYELLCGQLPFQGSTVTAVWSQIATKDPIAPSQYREGLDSALEATCLTMLAKGPDARYADMREVAQALKDYLKNSPSTVQPNGRTKPVAEVAKLQTSPEFWQTQRGKFALGILGLMILLAVVIVFRTPYGDLTVTVNDDNLEVVIDNDTVEFTDKKWNGKKKARQHQLALKLQGVEIPFDESKGAFIVDGRRIAIKLQHAEVNSNRFEVLRGGKTVLEVLIEPAIKSPDGPLPNAIVIDYSKEPDFENSIGMKFRPIPPGEFDMGSRNGDMNEQPVHHVTITKPFYMGKYEVTQREYIAVMGANPSKHGPRDNLPVEFVTWENAVEFCRKLSALEGRTYRLPREAEWEYGCRAGTTTEWSFGDDPSVIGEYAWVNKQGGETTHDVGLLKPNGFGLYDMHGNVFEYCSDWTGTYAAYHETDPVGAKFGRFHGFRGGSWFFSTWHSRSAKRQDKEWPSVGTHVGFRVVREMDSDQKQNTPPLAVAPFESAQARKHQEAWAAHLGIPVKQTNSIGMRIQLIPPGDFIMGSTGPGSDGNERPEHPVRISRPFLIGASEVTVGQFRQFVEATDYKTEAEADGTGGTTMMPGSVQLMRRPDLNWQNWWDGQNEDHPVVNVSWNDAVAFCDWLSEKEGLTYRLPTNAEYEYASRAGTTTRHPFGEQIEDLHAVANLRDKAFTDMFGPDARAGDWDDGFAMTAPVDVFPANNFGLHDMPGNVNEWCSDWFGPYESALQIDPQGPASGTSKVLRGGYFAQLPERFVSSNRGTFGQSSCHCGFGYRVVRELDPDRGKAAERSAAADPLQQKPLPKSIEQIAQRRQAYLDKYLKVLETQPVEEYPDTINAASFPPQVTLQTTLSAKGLKSKYFKDAQCKMPLDPDIVGQGQTAYFKAQVDTDGRVHLIESHEKGGVRSEKATGWAAIRYWYDEDGRKIQETFLDKNDKPAENRDLVIIARHAYDTQREFTETRFYGGDMKEAEDYLGVHRRIDRGPNKQPLELRLDGSPRIRWLKPLNLGKRINEQGAWQPALTPDGKEMYFAMGFTGRRNYKELGIYKVDWLGTHWSDPKLVLAGGKPLVGLRPTVSSDGQLMAVVAWKKSPFLPDLPNYGGADVYVTERKNGEWQALRNAGPEINQNDEEGGVAFLPGTHTLCLSLRTSKTPLELWLSDRIGDQWSSPRPLGIGEGRNPIFTADGKRMYFNSTRTGTRGNEDIWVADWKGRQWSRPINLGPDINSGGSDGDIAIFPGGGVIYYCRCCPWNIYVTGRADDETAIRHVADIYAHGDMDSP